MEKLPLIVDAHTHLFNARYVPLKGILQSWGVGPTPAYLLSKLVYAVTGRSKLDKIHSKFSISPEDAEPLSKLMEQFAEITVLAMLPEFNHEITISEENILIIQDSFVDDELHSILLEINDIYGCKNSAKELEINYLSEHLSNLSHGNNIEFLVPPTFSWVKMTIVNMLKSALEFVDNTLDTIDFVLNMLLSEKMMLGRLTNYYDDFAENFLLFHYMMDMEYPYKDKPKYEFYRHQLPRMTALEKYSKGKVIGFSAFDAIRFSQKEYQSEDELKALIEAHLASALEQGKIGFKFYPPMGFKPFGNSLMPRIQFCVDIFLDFCVENRIPVFTHCTPEGFEVTKGSGLNSDPEFWEKAIKHKPSRKNLILCFGHAGGGERKLAQGLSRGWLAKESEWGSTNYAFKVAELCRTFEFVYCDLSYLHEILDDPQEYNALKCRLIIELNKKKSVKHPYLLSDKMMYGSDWHMKSVVNNLHLYLEKMINIFQDECLVKYRNKFFCKNAIMYIDIESYTARARDVLNASCYEQYMDIISLAKTLE